MMSFLSFSQSLIPSVIKIDSTKYYCYDSVSIRKIAVIINNSFTCDSIVDSYKVIVKDFDSLQVINNKEKFYLQSEIDITKKQLMIRKKENILYEKEILLNKRKIKIFKVIAIAETSLILLLVLLK